MQVRSRRHRPRRQAIQYSRDGSVSPSRPRRAGFPAFAGTTSLSLPIKHTPAFSRCRTHPSLANSLSLFWTEGAGKAGCWPHPWSACNKKARGRTTGTGRTTGLPCATVLTAYTRSPRCAGLFGHRHLQHRQNVAANLASASGRQDHTISPSVSLSVVLRTKRQTVRRPSHHVLNVRDDRETPLR